jgi:MauM/NapG family ferredoxin protein
MSKDKKDLSRRDLLTFWRRGLKELSEPAKPAPAPLPPPKPVATPPGERRPPLRPPGMMHELMLVNACMRCGKCVEACPAEAIHPLPADWGNAAGTPFINAREQPCVVCEGLKCTHVCPSGALVGVHSPNDITMGTAILDDSRCLAFNGTACDVCFATCPLPGAIVVEDNGHVRVVDEKCVGCGLCEHVCPTQPTSIRVVPRD